MAKRVPEIIFLGNWNQPKNGFLRQVEQGFSPFLPFFAIFDDFSKWGALKVLRNFEKSSNMAKNEEKPCSTHFLADDSGNSKIGFRVLSVLPVVNTTARAIDFRKRHG